MYLVRIVGPIGLESYLCRGREVDAQDDATHYPHPSNARRSAERFHRKHPRLYVDVIDSRDPERYVP